MPCGIIGAIGIVYQDFPLFRDAGKHHKMLAFHKNRLFIHQHHRDHAFSQSGDDLIDVAGPPPGKLELIGSVFQPFHGVADIVGKAGRQVIRPVFMACHIGGHHGKARNITAAGSQGAGPVENVRIGRLIVQRDRVIVVPGHGRLRFRRQGFGRLRLFRLRFRRKGLLRRHCHRPGIDQIPALFLPSQHQHILQAPDKTCHHQQKHRHGKQRTQHSFHCTHGGPSFS